MTKLIPAIYEHGIFKLSKAIKLPEHQRVILAVAVSQDEIPTLFINKLAEGSQSFEFLNNPQEDIYSPTDGKEV